MDNIGMNRCYAVLMFLFVLLLSSCDSTKIKDAQESLDKFTRAYKNENVEEMSEVYPDVAKLRGQFMKVDKIVTQQAEVKDDDLVELQTILSWENPFGKNFERDVTFTMSPIKKEGKKVYIIQSTKGFVDFSESNIFKYVKVKEPGITSGTDVEKSERMEQYRNEFILMKDWMRRFISENLVVSDFSWDKDYYSDYATGRCNVMNNLRVAVPHVKYNVLYLRNGELVTQDQGVASYGELKPGEMVSISILTSHVGNANRAKVNCYVDDEKFIEQGVVAAAIAGLGL